MQSFFTGKGTDKLKTKNDNIESGCPPFWKAFDGNCYKVHNETTIGIKE